MNTKLSTLPGHLKLARIYFIGTGSDRSLDTICPAIIAANQNSTGNDIVPIFSTENKARSYQGSFPSLARLNVFMGTPSELIEIFAGKVDHFIMDPAREDYRVSVKS